jgi:hypothetical protein
VSQKQNNFKVKAFIFVSETGAFLKEYFLAEEPDSIFNLND